MFPNRSGRRASRPCGKVMSGSADLRGSKFVHEARQTILGLSKDTSMLRDPRDPLRRISATANRRSAFTHAPQQHNTRHDDGGAGEREDAWRFTKPTPVAPQLVEAPRLLECLARANRVILHSSVHKADPKAKTGREAFVSKRFCVYLCCCYVRRH